MNVYHGSILEISKPDNLHSQNYLDFGRGFYVTSYQGAGRAVGKEKRHAARLILTFLLFKGIMNLG